MVRGLFPHSRQFEYTVCIPGSNSHRNYLVWMIFIHRITVSHKNVVLFSKSKIKLNRLCITNCTYVPWGKLQKKKPHVYFSIPPDMYSRRLHKIRLLPQWKVRLRRFESDKSKLYMLTLVPRNPIPFLSVNKNKKFNILVGHIGFLPGGRGKLTKHTVCVNGWTSVTMFCTA